MYIRYIDFKKGKKIYKHSKGTEPQNKKQLKLSLQSESLVNCLPYPTPLIEG